MSWKAIDNSNSAPFFLESIDVPNTCLHPQIPDLVNKKDEGDRDIRTLCYAILLLFAISASDIVE
jgi:hypothetical protein